MPRGSYQAAGTGRKARKRATIWINILYHSLQTFEKSEKTFCYQSLQLFIFALSFGSVTPRRWALTPARRG
jgi:hypothetical protein